MLRIHTEYLEAAREAATAEDLQRLLLSAIRLEHAIIPPYLTAAYSLTFGTNTRIRNAITAIAEEEMLHMAILTNILNAIGGRPEFDRPDFVPNYPGTLPMSIGEGLVVGLKKFSKELNQDVFMKIEEPENPLNFPGPLEDVVPMEFATIGEFYRTLIERITELGDAIFTGDPARQVFGNSAGFPPGRLFPITDAATAALALRQVVREGEGTEKLPTDEQGQKAHYYLFSEIDRGRQLKQDATVPEGFSYTGTPLPFAAGQVLNVPDNPKAEDYPVGSAARAAVDAFNRSYSDMLRSMQRTFDGDPGHIGVLLPKMGQLRLAASNVLGKTDPNNPGKRLGLTFQFVPA